MVSARPTMLLLLFASLARTDLAEPLPDGIQRFDLDPGHYLLATPVGYEPGDAPPLILTLHGTDGSAETMINAWRRTHLDPPCLIVAPQNGSPGWVDGEAGFLLAVYADLVGRLRFDPRRVLLHGHSAGGAMAFYMIYHHEFPASAVATSANYLPPTVTTQFVRARADVPVFYAVGRADGNLGPMREGLLVLRDGGARVTAPALGVGHVLDYEVLHQAADWFAEVSNTRTLERLAAIEWEYRPQRPGHTAAALEEVLRQRRYHDAEVIRAAERIYAKVVAPGEEALAQIVERMSRKRDLGCYDRLVELEQRFGPSDWCKPITRMRQEMEGEPAVVEALEQRRMAARREEARRLLDRIERLRRDGRFEECRAFCEVLLAEYPDLPEARRAQKLANELRLSGG